MTRGLVQYQKCGAFDFLMFSCYPIESEWTAQRREANKMLASGLRSIPPFAKNAKDGAPKFVRISTSQPRVPFDFAQDDRFRGGLAAWAVLAGMRSRFGTSGAKALLCASLHSGACRPLLPPQEQLRFAQDDKGGLWFRFA